MKREQIVKIFESLTADNLVKATEGAIEKIYALHGKDIEGFKTKLETVGDEKAALDKQLKSANGKIADLGKLDPEAIQKEADKWKAEAKKFETDAADAATAAKGELAKVKRSHDLGSELTKAGAKNIKAVSALLDQEKIVHNDDGTFTGLSEQLEGAQKSDAYLFNEVADEEGDETPEIDKVSGLKIIKSTKSTSGGGDAMMNAAMAAAGVIDEGDKK